MQGLLYRHRTDLFSIVTLFLTWLYGAAKPKRFEMVLKVIKLAILNLKGYQNFIIGSKVAAILLNGWIWWRCIGKGLRAACVAGLFLEDVVVMHYLTN